MAWRSRFLQTAFCPALIAVSLVALNAKTQDRVPNSGERLAFDAVSIHERSPQGSGNMVVGMHATPGRLADQCATLKSLIFYAYHFSWFASIDGLPKWAAAPCGPDGNRDTYIFQATMPLDTTEAQARQMMQNMLADRFKLAVHWEKKPGSVYALVVAKGGFKGRPYDSKKDPPIYGNSILPCPPEDRACHPLPLSPGPISQLASALASVLQRPVIDKTGLNGTYDLRLKWAGDLAANSPLPSLPTALRENFGLELKPETGEVNVLVIDHAEKPTPN
ncbi:MAG TPA: TIGR03435 family protein [Candidatus Acidoferrales bacterium]|nr:TIGR03435 family protein [Candidatus Acidoferrales bacterium]